MIILYVTFATLTVVYSFKCVVIIIPKAINF